MPDPDLLSVLVWLVPHLPNAAPGEGRAFGGTKKPQAGCDNTSACLDRLGSGPANPSASLGSRGESRGEVEMSSAFISHILKY